MSFYQSIELDAAVNQYQEKFEMFEREKRSADQRQRRDCAGAEHVMKVSSCWSCTFFLNALCSVVSMAQRSLNSKKNYRL